MHHRTNRHSLEPALAAPVPKCTQTQALERMQTWNTSGGTPMGSHHWPWQQWWISPRIEILHSQPINRLLLRAFLGPMQLALALQLTGSASVESEMLLLFSLPSIQDSSFSRSHEKILLFQLVWPLLFPHSLEPLHVFSINYRRAFGLRI